MIIGGLQKFSLIDYPDKVAAVVFTKGCNFRCRYCHNSELVLPELFHHDIPQETVIDFLSTRIGKLDGVVVTGGEPTLHKDLPEFILILKSMGFEVKLDTNGSNPAMLEQLLNHNLIDFVAMDIKAPLEKYPQITGVYPDLYKILASIELVKNSDLPYQFRTTVVDDLFSYADLVGILELINFDKNYIKQTFQPSDKVLDPTLIPASIA